MKTNLVIFILLLQILGLPAKEPIKILDEKSVREFLDAYDTATLSFHSLDQITSFYSTYAVISYDHFTPDFFDAKNKDKPAIPLLGCETPMEVALDIQRFFNDSMNHQQVNTHKREYGRIAISKDGSRATVESSLWTISKSTQGGSITMSRIENWMIALVDGELKFIGLSLPVQKAK